MKKLFLFLPALLLSLLANAAVINITPTSPHSSNNLRQVVASASSGDIIEMAAGTYVETGNWIAFDDKEIIVRAAEGAEVIIKPQYSVRVKAPNAPAKAEFVGVKFDCSALESNELFVPSDDKPNQKVILTNCEFYDWVNNRALIHSTSTRRLDVININNCYFHGFEKSIVFLENANLVSLSITNSTFANIAGASEYFAAPIDVRATSGDVLVDHCTFYNVNSMSLSYGVVNVTTITDPIVSNCIFMLPTSIDRCATYLKAGGQVKNTLTYNYDNWQPYGHYNTATVTNCIKTNPLFKDAANEDFSLYAGSQARGAGDDDSDLGDPCWYTTLSPVAIPATLIPFNALLSNNAGILFGTPDSIDFKVQGSRGETDIEWAKWKVTVDKSGLYNFTAFAKRTGSSGSQKLEISVLNSNESEELISKLDESIANEGTISTGNVNLVAGNTYVVKVRNTYNWAVSKLTKVEATYAGGAVVNIPGQILCEEAVICQEEGGHTPKMYHLENGDLKYDDNGYNLEEYAYWNIIATEAGEMAVTLNIAQSGHTFSVELYQGETRLASIDESGTTTWDGGNITLTDHLTIPSTGSYTLKLINKQQYSSGALHGITIAPYVAPADVTMTDTDADNSAWVAHVGGDAVDVQLNRTILGGMFNTICLPFTVNSTKCKVIFGDDVELYTLGSATISGDILNLQFNTASDIWKGTPILIKTSTDIVNPLFEGVSIERETADRTSSEAVTFRGTFIQSDFHNGDQILLLVANNKLAYPLSDRTLKGFRAYFEINNPQAGAPIRSARIIAGEQVATNIELVATKVNGLEKMIENGQLIIVRDGVRYNVIGTQVK